LADLLEGLGSSAAAAAGGSAGPGSGASGLGGARKLLEKLDRRGQPVAAPLPRPVAERLERQAGYDDTKQEVTKWQPIVKVRCGASLHQQVSCSCVMLAGLQCKG
jgi:hypothetical protein